MKVLFPVVLFCASATLADVVFPAGETNIAEALSFMCPGFGALILENDAKVAVAEGGSISFDTSGIGAQDVPVMHVGTGSVFKVSSGASVTFNDFAGRVSFEGAEENPAKLLVDGGELKVNATRHSGMNLLGQFVIGRHSLMEVSGDAIFELSSITGTSAPRFSALRHCGGTILVKDNAQFKLGDICGTSTFFSNGYVEFSGNSVMDYCSGVNSSMSGLHIGTSTITGDMATEVVFKDNASTRQINFGYPMAVRIVNPKKGTWSTLRLQSKGTIGLGALTMVGAASTSSSWKGGSTLEISDGYVQSGGNYGLVVGHVCDGTTQFCTGIVNVAGGAYMVRAGRGGNSGTDNVFCGTLIGRGPAIAGDAVYADATLNVSGGVFTNQVAYFVVGTGRSVGRVVQTGGEIRSTPYFKRPLVVGFAGGNGLFTVSNGVTTASSDVYVGGAPLSALEKTAADTNYRTSTSDGSGYGENYELGGAVGRLTVASSDSTKECSFIAHSSRNSDGKLHVGFNGIGEVEVGAGAALTVNGAEFAGPGATLKCTLGEDGAGIFKVKGELMVGEGAKLEVDASAYRGSRSWVKLVDAETRSGSFAVTVKGSNMNMEVVERRPGFDDGSVWLFVRRGLCVTVK